MFCAHHSIPHEDCPTCLPTVAVMRPTVFAELAAAELLAGTSVCRGCDYVFYKFIAACPRCAAPHPILGQAQHDDAAAPTPADSWSPPVVELHELTLRDLGWTHLGNGSTAAQPAATRGA